MKTVFTSLRLLAGLSYFSCVQTRPDLHLEQNFYIWIIFDLGLIFDIFDLMLYFDNY